MAAYTNPPLLSEAPSDGDVIQFNLSTGQWDPVSVADAGAITVPQAHPTEPTQSATDAPAGGTGAAQGAWDTSAHRDAAIATINDTVTDVAALITWADALQTKLTTAGILD